MGQWPIVDKEYLQEYYRALGAYNANSIFSFIEEQPELTSHIFLTCEGVEEGLEEKLSDVLDATYSYMTLGHMYDNKILSDEQPVLKKFVMDAFSLITHKSDFTALALKLCAEMYYVLVEIKETEIFL